MKKYIEFINEINNNLIDDKYEIKYEKLKKGGYSQNYMSYNLYKNDG